MTNSPSVYELNQQEEIAICIICQTPWEQCDGMATPDPDICPLVNVINARPERAVKPRVGCKGGDCNRCSPCKSKRMLERAKDAVRGQERAQTVKDFAIELGIGNSTVHKWTRIGELKVEWRKVPREERTWRGASKVKYIVGVREEDDEP